MTVNYGFFPYKVGTSPEDRSYTTIIWAKFFGWLFPHEGVVEGIGSNLAITATGTPDMYVHVAPGVAVASGYYWLENTASFSIPIATADPTNPRIDLIVAKFRLTGDTYRDALLTVHTGIPAASPIAPTPTVSADVIEIALGHVDVAAGATQIQTANITAAASQPLCGYVAARIGKAFAQVDGSLNAGSLPIHGVGNPGADTDADTQGARNTAITEALSTIAPAGCYILASASNNLKKSRDTEISINYVPTEFVPKANIRIPISHKSGGVYRVSFDLGVVTAIAYSAAYAQIYCNDIAWGTSRSKSGADANYTTFSEDLTLPDPGGAEIQLRIGCNNASAGAKIRNFRIYCDETVVTTVSYGW